MGTRIEIEELLGHAGWLRRLAGQLIGDAHADDLVQETWVAALRRAPDGERARPWLARVVRNLAHNRRRDERCRSGHEATVEPERTPPTPAELAEDAEAQRLLAEAVTRLAEPLRSAVVLHWFHGLDSAEIGRQLGVPASTVRSRLQKALVELRAELDRRSGDRRAWSVLVGAFARRSGSTAAPTLAASATFGTAATWTAVAGGVALLAAVGMIAWQRARDGRAAQESLVNTPGSPIDAANVVALAPADPLPERAPLEPEIAAASATFATEEPVDLVELSGTILVDGRPAEWPIELALRPSEATEAARQRRASERESKSVTRAKSTGVHHCLTSSEHPERFTFERLPADWAGRIELVHDEFEDGTTLVAVDAPSSNFVLRLRLGAALQGRLFDASRTPVAARIAYETRKSYDDPGERETSQQVTESRADGRFRIPLSPIGRALTATVLIEDEHGHLRLEVPAFTPADGHDCGDLVLAPVREVAFRVLDAEGKPVPRAFARIDGPDWARRSESTDEDGRGALRWMPGERTELRFSSLSYADRVVAVEGSDALEVVLDRLAALEVQLVGVLASDAKLALTAPGAPFVWNADGLDDVDPARVIQLELGATTPNVRRSDASLPQVEFSPRADGRFLLVGLRPGLAFELEVRAPDGRVLAARSLALAAHEWARVEIPLGP